MTTYRAGLVGCGRIGTLWETDPPTPVTHAGALAMLPQTQLVAGASRGSEHLHAFGKQWGIDALYLDYQEMLATEKLDIVCIATHPGLHRPIVEAAVAAGAKGIFCEKPLALSLEDADAIVAACREANCVLSVNHSRRWDPAHRKAKALVEAGAIGDLVSLFGICQGVKPFPAWVADEEGPLLHDAVHLFDLFRLFGGEPQSVVGTALRRQQPFPVEDDSHAIFELNSGLSAVAMVNERTRYFRFELQIQGTEGVIVLSSAGNQFLRGVDRTDRINEPNPIIEWYELEAESFPSVPTTSTILDAVAELVQCIESGSTPSSPGEDGVASLEMVMGVYESQLQGNKPVTFPLVARDSALYRLRAEGYYS
ncbi:MAG: Gfo/Idh/MocA family oxidoreductase [Caldilineaceae bacterium]|nr:Gfo/Idh/MocA family oxidoreductase [Caldilineaceae bacterium]